MACKIFFMKKQGPLDIQIAIFEDHLEVWVCNTRNIQKMDFLKMKIMAKHGQLSHFTKILFY